MRIVWSPEAVDDLSAIRAFIVEDSPAAARRIASRIIHDIEAFLPENPEMGRPGRVPGTRELVIAGTPFLVPCRLSGGVIEILRVYHGKRRWPKSL